MRAGRRPGWPQSRNCRTSPEAPTAPHTHAACSPSQSPRTPGPGRRCGSTPPPSAAGRAGPPSERGTCSAYSARPPLEGALVWQAARHGAARTATASTVETTPAAGTRIRGPLPSAWAGRTRTRAPRHCRVAQSSGDGAWAVWHATDPTTRGCAQRCSFGGNFCLMPAWLGRTPAVQTQRHALAGCSTAAASACRCLPCEMPQKASGMGHINQQDAPGGGRTGFLNSAMSAPGFEQSTKPIWPHGYVGMLV